MEICVLCGDDKLIYANLVCHNRKKVYVEKLSGDLEHGILNSRKILTLNN
jgi:hypothetical protein